MTLTEELRGLLDDRGVEWSQTSRQGWYVTEWESRCGSRCSAMEWNPTLTVMMPGLTPAQAVEATLGRGECRECHATERNYRHCKYSVDRGWCDDGCKLPKTRIDHGSIEYNGVTEWRRCSVCGEEVLAYPANYCPNCGRKVV